MIDESHEPGEQELREIFAVLRREEHSRTPPFRATVATRTESARWRRSVWIPLAASLCAVAILAMLPWPRPRPTPRQGPTAPVASITQWRPPTEFLLETPGREMLHSIPEFGAGIGTRPYPGSAPPRAPQPPPPHGPPRDSRAH